MQPLLETRVQSHTRAHGEKIYCLEGGRKVIVFQSICIQRLIVICEINDRPPRCLCCRAQSTSGWGTWRALLRMWAFTWESSSTLLQGPRYMRLVLFAAIFWHFFDTFMKIAGHQFNLSTVLCIIPDLGLEKTQHKQDCLNFQMWHDSNAQKWKYKRARGGR